MLTPLCNAPSGSCPAGSPSTEIDTTVKIELAYGTYRLYCQAPGHERGGMYVDLAVGGVGQVG